MKELEDQNKLNTGLNMATLSREAKARGLTLYKLHKLTGIPMASIYYYGKHPGRIPLELAEKIRKCLDMSPEQWAAWFEDRENKKVKAKGGSHD